MARDFKEAECLVIGANGLVGRCLGRALSRNGIKWSGTFYSRQEDGLYRLDVTDKGKIEKFIAKVNPRVIFNCANLAGGVDTCESNPEKAKKFHLDSIRTLADVSSKIDAAFVFVSSDYIFDGTRGPYREADRPNPLNLYGRLKLEAEEFIKKNVKKHIIARTTNVFGWDPETRTPNYIMNLYRTIKAKKRLNAPSYLWGNPTYAEDLAEAISELYTKKASGVFHVVGASFINRYEWAKASCEILELDFGLVNEVRDPPANMVPRPLKSLLNTDKFTSSYSTVLHDVYGSLKLMRRAMRGSPENATLNI
jgi:dTDP-4-dehydrorhamnose reductase